MCAGDVMQENCFSKSLNLGHPLLNLCKILMRHEKKQKKNDQYQRKALYKKALKTRLQIKLTSLQEDRWKVLITIYTGMEKHTSTLLRYDFMPFHCTLTEGPNCTDPCYCGPDGNKTTLSTGLLVIAPV